MSAPRRPSRRQRPAYDEAEALRPRAADFGLFAAISENINQIQINSKQRRLLAGFEERRPTNASLAYVRGKLVELYDERVRTLPSASWFVTADDADRILKAWTEFPSGGSQNWRGSIFRGWERIPGDVPSLRPSHNGTPLARWRPRRET